MSWTAGELKDIGAFAQSVGTILSFCVVGYWAYRRYVYQEERYPHIEFSVDINFVGLQNDYWIVELIAYIENKGKVQHTMHSFEFDLSSLYSEDPVEITEKYGGQVDFPRSIQTGTFLTYSKYFFIDPNVKAKYSYVTRVPKQASFLIFHSWFAYSDKRNVGHSAEKTVKVPAV
jgi:hypothetical protein